MMKRFVIRRTGQQRYSIFDLQEKKFVRGANKRTQAQAVDLQLAWEREVTEYGGRVERYVTEEELGWSK